MTIDVTGASDLQLSQWLEAISREQARRQVLETAQQRADQLAVDYLDAAGVAMGDEWTQPAGAYDAYPQGWVVSHGGKSWISLTPANVWEPGVSGWREQTETADPPAWVRPTGAHDAYNEGDRVLFEGEVYTSLIDANTWSPSEYPAGWAAETPTSDL